VASFVQKTIFLLPTPPFRAGTDLFRALGRGHGLRRIVPGLTTILGYHLSAVLSSENGYFPNPSTRTGGTGRAHGHSPYAPCGFTQGVVPVGARRRPAAQSLLAAGRLAPTSPLPIPTLSTDQGRHDWTCDLRGVLA
jgi:hypothetical protein